MVVGCVPVRRRARVGAHGHAPSFGSSYCMRAHDRAPLQSAKGVELPRSSVAGRQRMKRFLGSVLLTMLLCVGSTGCSRGLRYTILPPRDIYTPVASVPVNLAEEGKEYRFEMVNKYPDHYNTYLLLPRLKTFPKREDIDFVLNFTFSQDGRELLAFTFDKNSGISEFGSGAGAGFCFWRVRRGGEGACLRPSGLYLQRTPGFARRYSDTMHDKVAESRPRLCEQVRGANSQDISWGLYLMEPWMHRSTAHHSPDSSSNHSKSIRLLTVRRNEHIVQGNLTGPVIARENIARQGVKIPLRLESDSIRGGIHTTGTKFGGKESMILTAFSLVLERVSGNSA